jgi:hypothetical protein
VERDLRGGGGVGEICALVEFLTGKSSIVMRYAKIVRLHIPLVASGDR